MNTLKSRVKQLIKRALGLPEQPVQPIVITQFDRKSIADYYLTGSGIEIGALHNPLQVPDSVDVKYVDCIPVSELRQHYPELAEAPLVDIDILDDGEHLSRIPDSSQAFVIANHFIEHCQDPIHTIQNMLRVLQPNGILYMGIPDKRYTFDIDRPITTLEHLLKDYREGPEWSRKQHFREYAKFSWLRYKTEDEGQDDPRIEADANRFMQMNFSIHFHAWTQAEILELLAVLRKQLNFGFEVELFFKKDDEMILVLRKTS